MNALNSIESIGTGTCCDTNPKMAESPNLLETFRRKKLRLESQLQDVKNVIQAIESHPEINTLLELIAKAR